MASPSTAKGRCPPQASIESEQTAQRNRGWFRAYKKVLDADLSPATPVSTVARGDQGFPHADLRPFRHRKNADAHRALAQMEYDYWQRKYQANPDFYTGVAIAVSVDSRVALQRTMGDIGSLNLLLTTADWRIPPYFNR